MTDNEIIIELLTEIRDSLKKKGNASVTAVTHGNDSKRHIDKDIHININTNTDLKPLSSKRDISAENQILDFLIKRSGKNFKHVPANLRLITARIKEGHSEGEILSVIEKKINEWENDPKMAKYIRPATLFNSEKFNQYIGEIGVESPEEKNKRKIDDWVNEDKIIEGII